MKSYTEYKGTRCAMPMLADVYGLYYNKDLLQAAGFTAPPKTLGELESMAEKLTTYNADGSIKTLGFNPTDGLVRELGRPLRPGRRTPKWLKPDGTSAIGSSAGWKELIDLAEGLRRQDRLRQAATPSPRASARSSPPTTPSRPGRSR